MLRCAKLGLTADVLEMITMGMVYDMIVEESNDREEYPYEATADDVRSFFGG